MSDVLSGGTPPMLLAAVSDYSAVVSFSVYILLVFGLAILSNRLRQSKSFLSEYFLGSRTLGVWAFALTFAATSASGGSFMGFPALVYTHGWVLALWIAGYMLVPIVAIGFLAKRINQISRKTGAITIPDLMRGRFDSPAIGALATWFIVFFMIFNLVAQFKAGSKILQTLLSGIPLFDSAVGGAAVVINALGLAADPAYVFCLLVFALVVVAYTAYGGFRAVVWTDVLQGFFMVGGVLFMLPLAIWAVGGLGNATEKMATMRPPHELELHIENAVETIPKNSWIYGTARIAYPQEDETFDKQGQLRLFRVKDPGKFKPDSDEPYKVTVIEIARPDPRWLKTLEFYNRPSSSQQKPTPDSGQRPEIELIQLQPIQAMNPGKFVSLPGFKKPTTQDAFLPAALAISFFFFWTFSGAGQPSNMVRLMAFRNSRTLKRAIFTVCIYYSLIYFPIVIIFCCARIFLPPGWETDADRVMPEAAKYLTAMIEMPWLAGILVAAPFAAVMSTMDSFLLMISSSVVRDIYQRKYPEASPQSIKKVTYVTTIVVGVVAMLAAVNPPDFLQVLIIFTGGGLSTTFLAPVFLALYWPRINSAGTLAAMIGGFGFHALAYLIGTMQSGEFSAYHLMGFDPFVPGAILSLMLGVTVALWTDPPDESIVRKFFFRKRPDRGH